MDWLTWCIEQVPAALSITIAIALWLLSCVIAINLAFGKDSLFLYKQLEYAVGSLPAAILFHIGWFLWPIGLLVAYGVMLNLTVAKAQWTLILKKLRRFVLWVMCYIIATTSIAMLIVLIS
tara:strand:+ start:40771 stop:41133 length:363 start_codon:yes stop_codon:yes gene_type:complete